MLIAAMGELRGESASQFGNIGGWRIITDPTELAVLAEEQRAYQRQRRSGVFGMIGWDPTGYQWAADHGGDEYPADPGYPVEPEGARITTVLSALALNGGDRTPFVHGAPVHEIRTPAEPVRPEEPPRDFRPRVATPLTFVGARREAGGEVLFYQPPDLDMTAWETGEVPVVETPRPPETLSQRLQRVGKTAREWLAEEGQLWAEDLRYSWDRAKEFVLGIIDEVHQIRSPEGDQQQSYTFDSHGELVAVARDMLPQD